MNLCDFVTKRWIAPSEPVLLFSSIFLCSTTHYSIGHFFLWEREGCVYLSMSSIKIVQFFSYIQTNDGSFNGLNEMDLKFSQQKKHFESVHRDKDFCLHPWTKKEAMLVETNGMIKMDWIGFWQLIVIHYILKLWSTEIHLRLCRYRSD